MMLWNLALSALVGVAGFAGKHLWNEVQRLQILLNKTREEMYRNGLAPDRRTTTELNELIKILRSRDDFNAGT